MTSHSWRPTFRAPSSRAPGTGSWRRTLARQRSWCWTSWRSNAGGRLVVRVEARFLVGDRERRLGNAGALARHRAREPRSEEHTSELQSRPHLVCRLLLEKKKKNLICKQHKKKKKNTKKQ